MSDACSADSDDQGKTEQSEAALNIPAAWASGAVRQRQAWSSVAGEDGAAIFARLLMARAQGAEFHFTRNEISLTEARWLELGTVNAQVNHEIVAATDASRYGVLEYWAMPLAERGAQNDPPKGDCEDYALEKRARLIALGWDANALALAVAYAPGIGMHAVLIAQTDHGDFVLDNLHDAPLQPEALDYQWVSRQAGPSMTVWASATIESTASPVDPAQELLHAALEPAAQDPQQVPVALLSTVVEPSS